MHKQNKSLHMKIFCKNFTGAQNEKDKAKVYTLDEPESNERKLFKLKKELKEMSRVFVFHTETSQDYENCLYPYLCGENFLYLKNLYVHFIKNIFLDCSAKALSNKLLASGVSKSDNASAVCPCDHTK